METQKIIDILGTDYKDFVKTISPHIDRHTGFWGSGRELMTQSVKSADTEGYWFEFGVFRGNTISVISKTLIELGKTDQKIYGFDSFEGLPEDWEIGRYTKPRLHYTDGNDYKWLDEIEDRVTKKEAFNLNGQIPKKLLELDNVILVKGWFDKVLPQFISENKINKVSFLLHIDSDLYSSCKTILTELTPFFKGKCVIQFDELAGYPKAYENEYKAFYEFLTDNRKNIKDIEHIGRDAGGEAYSFLITFKH